MTESIRVLHVDDEPGFADMVGRFLEREDERIEVVTASGPAGGLERLSDADVDCVVADYDMPDRDGLEFLAMVREERPDLPFVLFTGKGSEEVASEALTAGATDYLQKGTGTEQYQLLANRITNAVEQHRSKRRATNLERVRTLASDVNQSLVHATSRAEIEARIPEVFTEAEPYRYAAVARVDPDSGAVEPRSWAGVDGERLDVFEAATCSGDGAEPGPASRAVRERRVVVSEDVRSDTACGSLRELASDRGFSGLAVVPMRHGDTLYGLLALFTDRPDAFDEAERDLLLELGDDVGHAIHAKEVRENLRRTRDRFRALFENAPGPVVAGDVRDDGERHVVHEVNEAFETVFGYDADAATGRDVADVIVPDTGQERHREFRCKAAAGEPVTATVTRATADGTREFLLNVIPYGVRDGLADGWFAWYTDVTDRAQREDRLQHQRSLFEALLETSIDGILVVDEDREFVTWNQQFVEMWGVPRELLGDDGEEFALEWALERLESPAAFAEKVEHLYEHPDAESRDEIRLTDGRVFDRYSAPVRGDDGTHYGRVWFFRDVTDRNERVRELERERNRFEAIFETIPEPSVHVVFEDSEPVVLRCNRAFEEVFGYDTDEVIGQSIDELVVPADRRTDAAAINRLSQEAGTLQTEVRRETASGERPFLFTAKTMELGRGADERIEGVGTYVDLSEQKRRESELVEQNERLEEFASVVSHDLRNPLSMATGRLALAREECDSDHLDSVASALDRMDRIVEDVLWLAREGRELTDAEPVALEEAVDAAMAMVADEASTSEAELEVHCVDDLGTVRADFDRLCRLFENVLRNAADHGGDVVRVGVDDLEDGFYVADDGPGIPEDDRDAVFDAGYSTAEDGTGFGLAIVRQVAATHGWEVRVTEGADGGARFEFLDVDDPAD